MDHQSPADETSAAGMRAAAARAVVAPPVAPMDLWAAPPVMRRPPPAMPVRAGLSLARPVVRLALPVRQPSVRVERASAAV